MVEDRIRNIEACVQSSDNLPEGTKVELLELLASLRAELQGVNKDHLDRAETASAVVAKPQGESTETIEDALGGLTGTVTELEATHPRLSALVNRMAVALSNMGI
jgi:hypothetical protein